MNKRFDPEKVEHTKWIGHGHEGWYSRFTMPCDLKALNDDEDVQITVLASDYDQLLGLYRQQKDNLTKAMATIEAIDRECLIGCRSLPSVRNATDSLISLVPGRHAKS